MKENIFTHKILPILSILILVSFIFINTNVFASITVNTEDTSISLQDISISSSSYLMFYNSNDNIVELIVAPEDSKIYYNLLNSTFYCANSNYSSTDFNYYYCIVTNNVGGNWSTVTTKSSFKLSNQEKIKQVGSIYPCCKDSNTFIDNLPDGVTWDDSFYISRSNGQILMVLATGDGVWVNVNGNGIGNSFRTSYDSSTPITLQTYRYLDNTWSHIGTNVGTHGYFSEAICYTDDIFNTDGTLFVSGMRSFFHQPPVTEQPEMVEIPALETVEQIPETIVKTLKLIIPVGLVVLSIFFVIYLVRRLIYQSL